MRETGQAMTTRRLFVAVFPPPEIREALVRAAHQLRIEGETRWTRAANVHLTLKFLGAADDARLEGIFAALDVVGGRHAPFRTETSGFGAFPTSRRARVLWVGIGAGAGNLEALAADVEGSLEKLGFEREARPYTPHLTLGRARRRPVRVELRAADAPEPAYHFDVRGFGLVESTLGAGGAVYSEIADFPLRGGGTN